MVLKDLWLAYRTQGYAAVRDATVTGALPAFYLALLAWAEDDIERAVERAREAVRRAPDDVVYNAARHYLSRVAAEGKSGVYVDGEAFAAFIRAGGNVGLYEAVNAALRRVYQEYETLTLLDVGVGDGLALLPALTRNIERVTLVEPSEAMLRRTTAALSEWNVPYEADALPIQEFMRLSGSKHWDVIQATWSLQSLPPIERPAVLRWMREHGDRVLVAEFDVPSFEEQLMPARVEYVVERYREGLAEYAEDGGFVAQGFLMPVMFGYFDRSAARTNYEGPIQDWDAALREAGFTEVSLEALFPYWWAEAYLIDAR